MDYDWAKRHCVIEHLLLYRLTHCITFYIIYVRTNVIKRNGTWR